MSMQDLISDYVARINNGIRANKDSLIVLKNKLIVELTKKLVSKGFFDSFKNLDERFIQINLKKGLEFTPKLIRVSKPGKRYYAKKASFPRIKDGFGYNLITTSKGVKTHLECLKENVGGEVVLQIIKQNNII